MWNPMLSYAHADVYRTPLKEQCIYYVVESISKVAVNNPLASPAPP